MAAAYAARLAGVPTPSGTGPVVGYVGTDVPLEVLDAAGIRAVRVCGDPTAAGTEPGTAGGLAEEAIDGMARSQLARVVGGTYAGLDHLLVSHDTEGAARLLHYASECRHLGIGAVPPLDVVDVLHRPAESSTRYSAGVVADVRRLADRLGRRIAGDPDTGGPDMHRPIAGGQSTSGLVTVAALAAAMARGAERRRLLEEVRALRTASPPRLRGAEALAAIGAAATLDVEEHSALLRELVASATDLPAHPGLRVLLTGSAHDHPLLYEAIEAHGAVIVGEDHDWGDAWFDDWPSGRSRGSAPDAERAADAEGAPDAERTADAEGPSGGGPTPGGDGAAGLDRVLARRYQLGAPRSGRHPVAARAGYTAARAAEAGAEVVLAVLRRGDGGPPWDVPAQRAALAGAGVPLIPVRLGGYGMRHVEAAVDRAVAALGLRPSPPPPLIAGQTGTAPPTDGPAGRPATWPDRPASPTAPATPAPAADTAASAAPARPAPPAAPAAPQVPAIAADTAVTPLGVGAAAAPAAVAPAGGPVSAGPAPAEPAIAADPAAHTRPAGATGERRAPRLEASAVAAAYQREWFAGVREQVAAGAPLAVVNADTPHEVLRAMGIPYVVNQWWASVCAARQLAPRYLGVLRGLGYPDDVEAYSALALGSALDPDPVGPPWGGLPPVDLLVAEATTDATARIFESWAAAQDAELVLFESTVAPLRPRRWFEAIHDGWEEVIGARRLDLMVAELRALIARVGELTGRQADDDELARVMELANEQAEWNARTRDLVARTSPAPIGVADAIPATMIPQWHRGTEWGRDAARRLHDEVAGLVEAGHGVVPDEQARLMWIGRGLWFDMGFYERVQARHGAVFVWSMYLAVAADAYLRRGADPLRALAGRFCGFADLYGTPPWSSEWYVKEARRNGIDGVVHLTDAVRGTHFVTRALEEAGVPVLEMAGSNVDPRGWDPEAAAAAVDGFIEGRVLPRAVRRRRGEGAGRRSPICDGC